ncbi:MAG: signal recognition particle-docking protein FtsY [Clostridiales bacterium]|jgi:fused signal recognition particle receptor|nr:signal recognition particle-docking protein FtsY [Clostridiales bacterium]
MDNEKGFFQKLKTGLEKTRKLLTTDVDDLLSGFAAVGDELFDELEEALILADLGAPAASAVTESVRARAKKERVLEPAKIKGLVAEEIAGILLKNPARKLTFPVVLLIIGVNGVGKTTSIGKLAHLFKSEGKKALIAAADTFRAAASDQLEIWAERAEVPIISHKQGKGDPAAVVFDAARAAKARGADVLLCDTAGRLHNKKNLMEELKKIRRVIERELPDWRVESLLTLDAATGQNALSQAKLFKEAAGATGLILTKLDSTAKGGVIVALAQETDLPVLFAGVGEGIDDLREFDPKDFAAAVFGESAGKAVDKG